MTIARLPWYGLAIVIVLVAAYGLACLGLTLCSPPPLTGDETWARWMRMQEALGIVFGHEARCFYRDRAMFGDWTLHVAPWGGLAASVVIAAAVVWETLGRKARRALRRRSGGHAILAGEPGEVESLVAAAKAAKSVVYLAHDRAAAMAIAWRHPFAEIAVLGDRSNAAGVMRMLGSVKAVFIAAVTGNDLANGELADAALADGGRGDLIVRLEQTSVRALKSDALRRTAEQCGRRLTVVSLHQMQAREALSYAMPGRYGIEGASRVHIAVCGAGPLLQEVAFLTVRQGYGLERAPPLISILRTGRSDFAAGALDLLRQSNVAEVHEATADGSDGVAIDRGFAAIALKEGLPLVAIHCCEEEQGAALPLALRLERAMIDHHIPVPPIVVHGDGSALGTTGMIRIARPTDLAVAHQQSALLDRRARAFHLAYLEGQCAARGDRFGELPAERDWERLPEENREDNRNSADHIDYKLARVGYIAVGHPIGPSFTEPDIEMLARIEHARWMASRGLRGFRYGPVRDDALLVHPDMRTYDQLDADGKRKDRDQVRSVPVQLAAAGEVPARLKALAFRSSMGIDAVLARLVPIMREAVLDWPLVAVALEGTEAVAIAERAKAAGFRVQVFIGRMPEKIFGDADLRRRAAAVLRDSWSIRVVLDGAVGDVLEASCKVAVDAQGRLNETALV